MALHLTQAMNEDDNGCGEFFFFFTALKNVFLTYFHHSLALVCFGFGGILMSSGYITNATDYIPSRWSPLVHKGEGGQWVVPLTFPVKAMRFVSRETQQVSTKPTPASIMIQAPIC